MTEPPSAECPNVDRLVAFVGRELPPKGREAVLGHLGECGLCRRCVAELARASAGLTPPAAKPPTLSRYEVRGFIGQGGQGAVYSAWDPRLRRAVAIKVGHAVRRAWHIDRREASVLARLCHPNIVEVLDVGLAEGRLFVVMPFVDGVDLGAWLHTRPTVAQILELFTHVGSALGEAHRAGVIHRDIKPSNILVKRDAVPFLIDFGLASEGQSSPAGHGSGRVGTPLYMAPEQLRGETATPRSDQFALCACMWTALTGTHPFAGTAPEARAAASPGPYATWDRRRWPAPRRVRAALERGLSADPRARWPSMEALVQRLTITKRSKLAWLGVVPIVVGAGVGAGGADSSTQDPGCASANQLRSALRADRTARSAPTAALDRYAEHWVFAFAEACDPRRGSEALASEAPGWRACLDESKREFLALDRAAARGEADASAVALGVEELVPPTDCTRAPVAVKGVTLKEAAAPRLARADGPPQLRRTRALNRAGLHDEALASARHVVLLARHHDDRGLEAAARYASGEALEQQGRYEAAGQELKWSYWMAARHRVPSVAARAARKLIIVSLDQPFDDGSGYWADRAKEQAHLAGWDGGFETDVAGDLAFVRRQQGELSDAQTRYEDLLELLPPDDPRRAASLKGLGVTLQRRGQYDRSRSVLREALDLYATRRASRPVLAHSHQMLATLELLAGEPPFERAESHYLEALRLLEPLQDELQIAIILQNLSLLEVETGRLAAAEQHARRAIHALRMSVDDSPTVAESMMSLAVVLHARDRDGEAVEQYQAALELLREQPPLPQTRAPLIRAHHGLCTTLSPATGERRAQCVRALELVEQTLARGDDDRTTYQSLRDDLVALTGGDPPAPNL